MAEFSPFAGLTALDDGDPITVDGGSFLTKNPRITDHLLQVGAVTHRHDAHLAVPNPQAAASGAVASGGSLPAGASYAVTYTVVDSVGGETLPAPALALSTGAGAGPPTIAPTVAADYTQGIMPAGGYFYGLTYTDGLGGETVMGPSTFATLDPGYASGAVDLSGMSAELVANGGQAVTWRLWRSYEGADWHLVTEASTDTYVDTGFDPPDNPALPPAQSTTSGTSSLSITLPTAIAEPALARAAAINVYLAADDTYQDPCFYAALASGAASSTFTIATATVAQGSPPHVSTSIPGAAQINALTDIANLAEAVGSGAGGGGGGGSASWIIPVTTFADLPSSPSPADAAVCITLDTYTPYYYNGDDGAWEPLLAWFQANAIGASAYTLALADAGGVVEVDYPTAATVTIPTNAATPYPYFTELRVLQYGAGQVLISPDVGVTLRSAGGLYHTAEQYSEVRLRYRGGDEWILTGDRA
jgi:hypothetical protein